MVLEIMQKHLLKIVFAALCLAGCGRDGQENTLHPLALSPQGPGAELAALELTIAPADFEKIRSIRGEALKRGRLIRPLRTCDTITVSI